MKNQKIVEEIVNQLFRLRKGFIKHQLPIHVENQLVDARETADKIPTSISDQLSSQKDDTKGEFDISIKKTIRHIHYKIGMNSSESKIYFSTFYAFYTRENITKIKHWIGKKMGEVKKDPMSSIQMMCVSRDTGNLVITQIISIERKTKKEMKEKVSFLLEQMEKYWPFKY